MFFKKQLRASCYSMVHFQLADTLQIVYNYSKVLVPPKIELKIITYIYAKKQKKQKTDEQG